jgi:hypothetical protein
MRITEWMFVMESLKCMVLLGKSFPAPSIPNVDHFQLFCLVKSCYQQLSVLPALACTVYLGVALPHTMPLNSMNPQAISSAKRRVMTESSALILTNLPLLYLASAARTETRERGLGEHLVLGNVWVHGICSGDVVL